MNARSSGFPILVAVALAVLHPPPESSALKCSGYRPEPLVAVNGTFVDTTLPELGLDRSEIFQVDIVCMDPADSSFNRERGTPVISVWTHDGPAP